MLNLNYSKFFTFQSLKNPFLKLTLFFNLELKILSCFLKVIYVFILGLNFFQKEVTCQTYLICYFLLFLLILKNNTLEIQY